MDTGDLETYEQQTIVLRLDKREAWGLLDILVDCDLSESWFGKDSDRIRLCDRLAHEIDEHKWRRHESG